MGKSSPLAGSSLSNDTIKCPKSRGEGCNMNADSFDQPSSSSLQLRRLPRARRMWSDLVICQPGKCNNLIPTKPRQRWLSKEAKIWQSIAIIILRAKTQVFSRLQHGAGDTQSSRAFPAPLASCHHCVECDRIGHHGLRKSSLHPQHLDVDCESTKHFNEGSKLGPTPGWDPLLSLSLFSVSLSYPISSWKWTRLSYLIWSRPSWPWVQNTNMVCSWTSIFDWMPTRPVVKASDKNLWGFLHVLSKLHVKSKLPKVIDPYWPLEMLGFLGYFLGPWWLDPPLPVPASLQQQHSHPPGSAGTAGADGGVETDEIRLELPGTEAQQPGMEMDGMILGIIHIYILLIYIYVYMYILWYIIIYNIWSYIISYMATALQIWGWWL